MQSSTPIIDLHVHSTIKPYGNNYYSNSNCTIFSDFSCIWHPDKYSIIDTLIENIAGIPRYRQSDFSTLVEGQVKIACVALYPLEKEFVHVKNPLLKPFEKYLAQFAGILGKKRIDHIKSSQYDYFKDLCNEYNYLKKLDGISPKGDFKKYKLISKIEKVSGSYNLMIIPTIEGCHSFCNGTDTLSSNNWSTLDKNIMIVKNWDTPPFFVTLAHHFYNGLCTHAKSLFNLSEKLLDQKYGMRDFDIDSNDNLPPISDLGKKVISLLLCPQNGKRIYIDVKHMSLEARQEYYRILEDEYSDENIPIIWSHGALNLKTKHQINLEFDDVKKIYETEGIIGIEMDERILGYNLKNLKKLNNTNKDILGESKFIWDQIVAIAEYAFVNNLSENPWQCIALGSDYDGIINPLNNFKDAVSLKNLYQSLIIHLTNYWGKTPSIIPENYKNMDAADVIYGIMYKNAFNFIEKNY